MIQISDLSKRFNSDVIFEKADLKIKSPGMYFILAPSGMGKSTLLNMIAGYESYDEGKIEYDGSLAYIDQEYHLIDELNTLDNIYLGLEKKDSDKELFKKLDIISLLNRFPKELSGGQRQRIGIARALINDSPTLILCDEPTESLDVANKKIVLDLLKERSKEAIVIVVSHDLDLVYKYADGIFEIREHQILKVKESLKETAMIYKSNEARKRDLKSLAKKLEARKDYFLVLLLTVVGLFTISLYIFMAPLFKVSDLRDLLNLDTLYFKNTTIKDVITKMELEHDYIINLHKSAYVYKAKVKDEDIIANIYPLPFKSDIKEELVLNQYAKELGIGIGDEINLVISVLNEDHEIPFVVKAILNEESAIGLNIYYDQTSLDEKLKNIAYNDTDLYDYTKDLRGLVYLETDYLRATSFYTKAEAMMLDVSLPYYDNLNLMKEEKSIYAFIFYTVIGHLELVFILLGLMCLNKDYKRYEYDLALISTKHRNIESLKSYYLGHKIISLLTICIFIGIFAYVFCDDYLDILMILFFDVLNLLIFLCDLMYVMLKWRKMKVMKIIKNA